MAREILRRVPVGGDGDYTDYDGDEEVPEVDEDWELFCNSFYW